ncbi:non-structural maintenance of chromosomes element 1 homolog isoform X1 [Mobula birostris]|uniref:non-structural maintenance of chromosomes element 1 homolog isoform X1 n=2 Tax=Mobula birostris TaxID=1983395 RepID=UPI003B28B3CC
MAGDWIVTMAAVLNDGHRRFLQTMMSQGILEGSMTRKLHRHCCELHKVHYRHDQLDEFIKTINTHLQPLFMEIRKGKSEDDGQQYYALINLAETEITRMAFDYTETELELFKKTMDLVLESESGIVSSTDILNLADQLQPKKMKKKEVEQVLQRFVQDKWLSENDGEYILSTRCIMELEQYIRKMYQDLVKECNICHNISIQGQTCEMCGAKIHLPCAAKYFQGRDDPCCPNCRQYWPHEIPDVHRTESSTPPPSSAPKVRHKYQE